jgi:hypothetical protein
MSAMEPSTTSQPPASEPVAPDTTETKAYGDRHFKPVVTPGLGGRPLLPEWLRNRLSKLFKRKP